MAKGVDRLIDWCITEISFHDAKGLSPLDFALAVKRYFSDAGAQSSHVVDVDGSARDAGAPSSSSPSASVAPGAPDQSDFGFAARAWTYVVSRPEVFVGHNRHDRSWNHLSLHEISSLPIASEGDSAAVVAESSQSSSHTRDLPAFQPRIYTSEETTWMNLTGHGIDYARVPLCRWQLLVPLAPVKEQGLAQADLGRLAGHDPRSVPKRTDMLAQAGYIVKRTVVIRGCKTSKLWLTRFAPPELPGTESPLAWQRDLNMSPSALAGDLRPVAWCKRWTGTTIDYDAFGRTLLAVVKACRVVRPADLRNKLGIQGIHWQTRVQRRVCRAWVGCGVFSFVEATLGAGGKRFRDCVKFLRDPTEAEWKNYLSTGGGKAKHRIKKARPAPDSAAESYLDSGPGPEMSSRLSAWVPEKPLSNTISETIKRGGRQGLSCPQISVLTVGYQFRRFLDSNLQNLAPPSTQPSQLSHLAVNSKVVPPRSRVFVIAGDERPPPSMVSIAAVASGTIDVSAAQDAFGFTPVPDALAKTPSDVTLSSLTRIPDQWALLHTPRSIRGRPRASAADKPAKAPGRRGRPPKVTPKVSAPADEDTEMVAEPTAAEPTAPVNGPSALSSPAEEKDVEEEPTQQGAIQVEPNQKEDEAVAAVPAVADILPARVGEPHSLRPNKRGRRPKASLVLIFRLEALKDPKFLQGNSQKQIQSAEALPAANVPGADDPTDIEAAVEIEVGAPETALEKEADEPPNHESVGEGLDEDLHDGPGSPISSSLESNLSPGERESPTDAAMSDLLLEARYNGHGGHLRLSVGDRFISFDYVPVRKGKNPLKIAISDVLDDPTIEVPPDDDDKALVINVSRNNSRWPYVFHFDNTTELCRLAIAFQEAIKAHRTAAAQNSPASEEPDPAPAAESHPASPETEPAPTAPPQPAKSTRKRKAAKISGGDKYKCEKCAAIYKNEGGLKYHLTKAQTSCNPDFVPPTTEERLRKRRRYTYAHEEGVDADMRDGPSEEGPGGTPRSQRSLHRASRTPVATPGATPRGFSRKHLDSSNRPTSSDGSELSQKHGQALLARVPLPDIDVSMVDSPVSGRSELPTNDDAVADKPESTLKSKIESKPKSKPKAQPQPRLEPQPEPQPRPQLQRLMALRDRLLKNAGEPIHEGRSTSGLVAKFVLPPEAPKQKMSTRTHQTVELIKYIISNNGGVFPGGQSLWIAVGVMYWREFQDQMPPTPRSVRASFDVLVRRKMLCTHTFAWIETNGSMATCDVILLAGVSETSPDVARTKMAMRAVYPDDYVPPAFAPWQEYKEFLQALLEEELSRMNGRGKRKRTGETEVLSAPFYENTPPQPARPVRQVAGQVQDLSGSKGLARGFLESMDLGPPAAKRRRGKQSSTSSARPLKSPRTGRAARPGNPGLETLPTSFFHGSLPAAAETMVYPYLEFQPPITEPSPDFESDASDGCDISEAGDGADSHCSAESPESSGHGPEATSQTITGDCFADAVVLRDVFGSAGSYPNLDSRYFMDRDQSFAIQGWAPSARYLLLQHLPSSVETMPLRNVLRAQDWVDPAYAKLCCDLDACRKWEDITVVKNLLESCTLAPDYKFFNIAGKDPTVFASPASLKLEWRDVNQFTLDTLPHEDLESDEDSDSEVGGKQEVNIRHVHFTAQNGRGKSYRPRGSGRTRGRGGRGRGGQGRGGGQLVRRGGGRGGSLGRGGSRAEAGRGAGIAENVPAPKLRRKPGPKPGPRPGRKPEEPKVPMYKHLRKLTGFPHELEDYFHEDEVAVIDDVDWASDDTRIAAFIAVRTLLGGVDKSVDWGVMIRLFPDTKLSALRKFWTDMRKLRRYYIASITEQFQEAFLKAYEEGELPPLDYDDVLAYDWRGLIRWTVNLVIGGAIRLSASRDAVERDFEVDEAAYQRLDWRDSYFHFQRSVWNRFQDATSEPAALNVDPEPAATRSPSANVDRIVKSWVRALCSTSSEFYSPSTIMAKIRTLGPRTEDEAHELMGPVISGLQKARVICRSKARSLRGGRPYRFTQNFLVALDKQSQTSKHIQAAAFKAQLDDLFRRGGTFTLPYDADDGAIMAIMNMHAYGRVRIEPVDPPQIPYGFEPGNYETRKYSKDLYHFGVQVLPTDRYMFTEDIEVIERARHLPPPASCSVGGQEIPAWYNFVGDLDLERWTKFSAAVFFVLATRGSMNAERASAALGSLAEDFDVQAVMNWGAQLGLVGSGLVQGRDKGTGNSDAVTVCEWWWLVIGKQFERLEKGKDMAGSMSSLSPQDHDSILGD